jgi:hypothetical protein
MLENTPIYIKHKNCPVEAVLGPFGIHYAKLICAKHRKVIQWLSESQYKTIMKG